MANVVSLDDYRDRGLNAHQRAVMHGIRTGSSCQQCGDKGFARSAPHAALVPIPCPFCGIAPGPDFPRSA